MDRPARPRKSKWRLEFDNYLVNEAPKHFWLAVWIIAQIAYFAQSYYQLWTSPVTNTFRVVLSHGLPIARAAANLINLNSAILLFTVCRNIISIVRTTFLARYVPFDKNITFHICIAWAIVFWSFVHCAGHFYNFYAVELFLGGDVVTASQINFLSGPGSTGQIITISLFLMVTSAMEAVRRKHFEIFWFTHHLFIVFFGGTLMHGSFCLIKGDSGDVCRGGPTFWKFWIASAVVYLAERILREVRGRAKTYISKVVQHPSNVVEVQFTKPSFKQQAGQYIFISCPEIATYEWHPFTLTSSPNEPFVSLHIRVVGDWTTAFARRLGCRFGNKDEATMTPPSSLPFVMIDGPYGSASEDVFDFEVGILVGAGIGVTPFASILKTIWYRVKLADSLVKLKKVYFVWVCRDKEAFEWFQDLLLTIEEENLDGFLDIMTYLTAGLKPNEIRNVILNDEEGGKDAITGLRSRTLFGRPNWDVVFKTIRETHPATDVGVFFCGPKVLSATLHKASNKWTDAGEGGTRFFYGKENF
ncbi:ferric reductase NAD binding domain-containing protein [Chytriomyces cf. hyalinus JEL632]|nr:ferric reductase NAD binding domain-containing protein [Chytriomyces cf. hyalinus JEL632]